MRDRLCLLVCDYFVVEVKRALDQLDEDDVVMASFSGGCRGPGGQDRLLECLPAEITESCDICILGGTCAQSESENPSGFEDGGVILTPLTSCFEMFIGKTRLETYCQVGVQLVTPGMLRAWQDALQAGDLDPETARDFFGESTTRLVLLDTGTDPESLARLRACSSFIAVDHERVPVSLEQLRLFLARSVLDWRLARISLEPRGRDAGSGSAEVSQKQRFADYALVYDVLGNLASSMDEERVIEGVLDLFFTLCAPTSAHFLPGSDTRPETPVSLPPSSAKGSEALIDRMKALEEPFAWTESGDGFLFQIVKQGELQGVVAVCGVALVHNARHYLNLALAIRPVLSLALSNAQSYRRLQQVQRRYSTTIESSLDAIINFGESGRISLFNSAAERMFGVNAGEAEEVDVASLFSEMDWARFSHVARGVGSELEGTGLLELEAVRADGSRFPIEVTLSREELEGRGLYTLVARDVTLRKQVEFQLETARDELEVRVAERTAELRASETRYRQLIEQAGDAIFLVDRDSGQLLDVNNQACCALGYSREELLALTVSDVDLATSREAFVRLTEGLQPREHRTLERGHRRKDGSVFPVEVRVGLVKLAERNVFLALARDITARKRAEEELRAAEQKYEDLYDNAPDMYVSVEPASARILLCNETVASELGYRKDEIVGQPLFFVYHPDCMSSVHETFATFRETGVVRDAELQLMRKDGSKVDVTLNASAVRGEDGSILHSRSSWRDITERKEAERRREELEVELHHAQRMDTVGTLAGGIAHDFNNILTAILGYAEFLSSAPELPDEFREAAEEITNAGERAATLTRQLLGFSRKQVLRPCILDLNEVVGGMEKMLTRLIGENIALTTCLCSEIGRVRADRGQIEQVLMNLVVNARDAMPGGGKLSIETSEIELDEASAGWHVGVDPGPFVELSVSDTGCGMDRETQAQIFEPFFTTKEQGKGTGLGLSMVYGSIKQSGGSARVYSEPGRGATFKIYLPRVDDVAEPVRTPTPDHARAAPGRKGVILVVEDDDQLRGLAHRVLENAGYTVVAAISGADALARASHESGPIDLVLSDVIMPGASGPEAADAILTLHPEARVLFMSGYTSDVMVNPGLSVGDIDLLEKPFTPDVLLAKVRMILNSDRDGRLPGGSDSL